MGDRTTDTDVSSCNTDRTIHDEAANYSFSSTSIRSCDTQGVMDLFKGINPNLCLDDIVLKSQSLLNLIQKSDKDYSQQGSGEDELVDLHNKIAELQKQLNIAIEANCRKNVMIEELDRTLSKMLESWKNYESEKTNKIRALESEKDQLSNVLAMKEASLRSIQEELRTTIEKLFTCQKEVLAAQEENRNLVIDHENKTRQLLQTLELKDSTIKKLEENRTNDSNLENKIRKQVESEYDDVCDKYDEVLQQLKLTENEIKVLQRKLHESQESNTSYYKQLDLLNSEIESIVKEKESLTKKLSKQEEHYKNEFELYRQKVSEEVDRAVQNMEERNAESKRNFELDYKAQIETLETEKQLCVENEKKKRQELENTLKEFQTTQDKMNLDFDSVRDGLKQKDLRIEALVKELSDCRNENDSLSSTRSRLMSKFQVLLESQWKEVLEVLYGNSAVNISSKLDFQKPFFTDLDVFPSTDNQAKLNNLSTKRNLCPTDQACNEHRESSVVMPLQTSLPNVLSTSRMQYSHPQVALPTFTSTQQNTVFTSNNERIHFTPLSVETSYRPITERNPGTVGSNTATVSSQRSVIDWARSFEPSKFHHCSNSVGPSKSNDISHSSLPFPPVSFVVPVSHSTLDRNVLYSDSVGHNSTDIVQINQSMTNRAEAPSSHSEVHRYHQCHCLKHGNSALGIQSVPSREQSSGETSNRSSKLSSSVHSQSVEGRQALLRDYLEKLTSEQRECANKDGKCKTKFHNCPNNQAARTRRPESNEH